MAQPTDRTATDQTLDSLIAEARAATGILPTIGECERLGGALRHVIGDLADQVRRRLDYTPRGSIDWVRLDGALLQAQGALLGGYGLGLRSAALHVRTLGEAAAVLADCIRDDR